MIKISTKYKGKKYYHADRYTTFDRIIGAIAWPGERPGFVVVVGETTLGREINRFILAESMTGSFGELLADAVKLQQRFDLDRWNTVFVPGAQQYIDIFNRKAFDSNGVKVMSCQEPMEPNDYIQMSIELILDSVKSGQKNLHFFGDSSLPAELQGLPTNTSKLKIIDYPAVAALGYAIAYLDEFKKLAPYVERESLPY